MGTLKTKSRKLVTQYWTKSRQSVIWISCRLSIFMKQNRQPGVQMSPKTVQPARTWQRLRRSNPTKLSDPTSKTNIDKLTVAMSFRFLSLFSGRLTWDLIRSMTIVFLLFLDPSWFSVKVHIFWEGHKNLRNLHQLFVLCTASQIIGGDFAKFCGLLRIYELYLLAFGPQ